MDSTTLDDIMKLKRFCYLGTFEPVHTHRRKDIDVEKQFPIFEAMLKNMDDKKMLPLMTDLLNEQAYVRRDEVLFIYATYLSGDIKIEWKTAMRVAFPILIETEEDLFAFCHYAQLIRKYLKRKGFSSTIRKALTAWYEVQSPDRLRTMWMCHRGLNGFTHKVLIKLCHIPDTKLGSAEVAKPFFQTCKELIKATEEAAAKQQETPKDVEKTEETVEKTKKIVEKTEKTEKTANTNAAPKNQSETTKAKATTEELVVGVAKLRTAQKNHDALKIIRKYKLPYNQVPRRFLNYAPILTQLLPTMTHFQIFKCWRLMATNRHLENQKIFKICKSRLENQELAKQLRMHPLHFLLNIRDIGIVRDFKTLRTKKVAYFKMEYLNNLYLDTFQWKMPSDNLNMHITINLQSNYKKKFLKYNRKLNYYEVCLALAFGYAKREANVDVFHWSEDKMKLEKIVFEKDSTAELAFNTFDVIKNPKNYQRLVTPIMNALTSAQCYDVFLCIVPTAGFGNPKQNSEFLAKFLGKYRENKNPNAKFIILSLLKSRRSMTYSETHNENILEICGLDEHTPDLIHNFATRRFE